MNKQFFLYILLLVVSGSVCEIHSQYYYNQTEYNGACESMNDEDQEIDVEEEAPKKSTFSESWGKVLSFDWTSLSKGDAYNIGVSIAAIGTVYCVWRYFPTRGNQAGYNPYIRPRPYNPREQVEFENQRFLRDFARRKKEADNFFEQMKNDDVYQAKRYMHEMPDLTKQFEETRKILEQNQERLREFQYSQIRPYLNKNSKVMFQGSLP